MAALTCQPSPEIAVDVDTFEELLRNLRSVYRNPANSDSLSVEEDDRRKAVRLDFEAPVRITPVLIDGEQVRSLGQSISGTTSNISLQGVALKHTERLLDFYAAVAFDLPEFEQLSLLVELQWTLQEEGDCFRSGARIVGLLEG